MIERRSSTHPHFPGCLLLACSVAALMSSFAFAQVSPVVPLAQCVEYPTAPATPQYIAHFSYYNSSAAPVNYRAGGSSNYFQPLPQTSQGGTFYPGFHPDIFRMVLPSSYLQTWYLGTSQATISAPDLAPYSGTAPSSSVPVCAARFVPAAIHLSLPGTYTHQYLGQVDSGPGPDVPGTFSVLAISGAGSNLTIANPSYVPGDGANPTNSLNPNSIYGDITIGAAGAGTNATIDVQLSMRGTPVVAGIVSVQP